MSDGDPILEPGAALDRLAAWKGRIDQLAADTRTMSDRLKELRVTAGDEDGLVEVSVDAQGALEGIRLSRRSRLVDPDALAEAIMSAVREARRQIADRAQQIIGETMGTESPAARAIAAQVGDRLRHTGTGDAVRDGLPDPGERP